VDPTTGTYGLCEIDFPDPGTWHVAAVRFEGQGAFQMTAVAFSQGQPTACVGDCNDNGAVTVDELVKGVNIALGTLTVQDCAAFDADGGGSVTVDELVKGVNAALGGC
jgi:hypothetical protein